MSCTIGWAGPVSPFWDSPIVCVCGGISWVCCGIIGNSTDSSDSSDDSDSGFSGKIGTSSDSSDSDSSDVSSAYKWKVYIYIRSNFSSKQIVHQSSFGLCFWVPDLLINEFY